MITFPHFRTHYGPNVIVVFQRIYVHPHYGWQVASVTNRTEKR